MFLTPHEHYSSLMKEKPGKNLNQCNKEPISHIKILGVNVDTFEKVRNRCRHFELERVPHISASNPDGSQMCWLLRAGAVLGKAIKKSWIMYGARLKGSSQVARFFAICMAFSHLLADLCTGSGEISSFLGILSVKETEWFGYMMMMIIRYLEQWE